MSELPLRDSVRSLANICEPHLTRPAYKRLIRWLTDEAYAPYIADIHRLIESENWVELQDSFRAVLPFGTGGRRGPRGVGPNRINARTIAESACGLARWAMRNRKARGLGPDTATIVIAYDTRIMSEELARVCAEVIAAQGCRALLFAEWRPTPQLSFAVRHHRADAGIVISASHNPPSDNGFKAYGPDGGQLAPPHDAQVMRAVKALSGKPIASIPFEQALDAGLVQYLGDSDDRAYRETVLAQGLCPDRNVRVVYTPLHGTGLRSIVPVLTEAGFHQLALVESQATPDGSFSQVTNNKPNPEELPALDRAGAQARETDAHIAIGTDPDADRLGCIAVDTRAVRTGGAKRWQALTGNQIGALLCHHVLSSRRDSDRLRPDALVLTTAVTSRMIAKIAASFGVAAIEELLVGFKYVARVIESLADPDRMVFACEESHGYLSGPYTRDKDAAPAALLLAEAAARANARGGDLWQVLDDLYRQYGYHCEVMFSEELNPVGGKARIRRMTSGLRNHPPSRIANLKVSQITDRLNNTVLDPQTGQRSPFAPIADPATGEPLAALVAPRDDLLIFDLAGDDIIAGARLAIRPSGTEPKCKFYASAWTAPGCDPDTVRDRVTERSRDFHEAFIALARGFVDK